MSIQPFCQNANWQLSRNLTDRLQQLDWQNLPVTTAVQKLGLAQAILHGWITGKWTLRGFSKSYGFFLQRTPTLLNIKLPLDVEHSVLEEFHERLPQVPSPTFRLQVMFGGNWLPIHRDKTMHASLVFPVSNHGGSWTRFYFADTTTSQLVDPLECVESHKVEIMIPTLLNVDICHDVWSQQIYTKRFPRISLTAKWGNMTYQDLINQL